MKRNYHHARKYRQLKYAVKQLKSSHKSELAFAKPLLLKIKRLVSQLKTVMSTYRLKRLIAPALLVLGTAFQNPVKAQQFAEPVTNPFGIVTSDPLITAPALVDLDDDGDLDLFTIDLGYNYLSNFYYQENTGSSTEPVFNHIKINPFGLSSTYVAFYPSFGDLDGDGDLDFIAGSSDVGIAFYENKGTAQKPVFGAAIINPFNINTSSNDELMFPELADLDGDDDLDILASDIDGDYYYFENIGDKNTPDFDTLLLEPFNIVESTSEAIFLRTADMDNDADLDLVVGLQFDYNDYTESYEAMLTYLENKGDATSPDFQSIDTVLIVKNIFNNFAIPTLGDLDGDGDFDIIAGQFLQPALYFENTGNVNEPLFNSKEEDFFGFHQIKTGERTLISSTAFVDLDKDGDLDMILGGAKYTYGFDNDTTYSSLKFYENSGTKTSPEFTLEANDIFAGISTYYIAAPAFTDLDKDGDLDLFITDYYGKISFFENTGDAQNPAFGNKEEDPFGLAFDGYKYSKLVFADIDDDGDDDGFYNKYGKLVFFQNESANGQVSFQDKGEIFDLKLPDILDDEVVFHNVADLDQDGDYDLWAFSYYNSKYYYFENIGTPSSPNFAEVDSSSINIFLSPLDNDGDEAYLMFPTFADLDNDGDQDLMFGSYYGSLYYYENTDTADMVIGIEDNFSAKINLYPNPTNDLLFIDTDVNIKQVEIYNTSGKSVIHSFDSESSVSLKDLSAGTYFVKVTNVADEQIIKKVQKF